MHYIVFIMVLFLSACSLTPEMTKPAAPVPEVFTVNGQTIPASTNPTAEIGWREMFIDKRLQALIELALINNRDLRIATLNVEAVKAQYGIERSARVPSVGLSLDSTRQRSVTGGDSKVSQIEEQNSLNVGISAFEIDLFGRARSLSDAAFARYLASDYGRQAAQISLISSVSEAYFSEQLAYEQLKLAEDTLADWKKSLELTIQLRMANQNSALDVAQAEGQVASAEAIKIANKRALEQARNALRQLVGSEIPSDLPESDLLSDQSVNTSLPAGLPSDLLLHRPDILQAEQNLIAANEDIGAARAAYFPRISLTTSIGYVSQDVRNLVGSDFETWSIAPQVTLPIFQGGRLDAELELAKVRKSTSIAEYEKAIQVAFKEVADGLVGSETYQLQTIAQKRAVSAAEKRAKLSALRYKAGVERRLELLDSQRQLYLAKQTLLELKQQELNNAVFLYKALGGGLK
ncbi:efflux transporter outer membrane subunit [Vibrio cholerae]|uniref:Efflux transporter outer membrane subunit n=2 Tax=Vibrio TaxID=662 RepID=A0A5C9SVE0_VIBCL|nr:MULTISPECIES: efflux transporter outer membrane subunit [Vibrio]EGS58888.1 outer membrane protein oprM [Vibrio paracholerae HE-09]MBW5416567.1 efflux transporter outer membrane subunit [Vibrio cholerae]MBW5429871.1 efflux transporter outer membrane subunit [Vibrio cholerae]MBY3671309.1 efflux transporter outer membrane subunit [Vibrio cholerae]MCO7018687.1 efflux transporter outer membrane subunit [Vibrio paracholerae]